MNKNITVIIQDESIGGQCSGIAGTYTLTWQSVGGRWQYTPPPGPTIIVRCCVPACTPPENCIGIELGAVELVISCGVSTGADTQTVTYSCDPWTAIFDGLAITAGHPGCCGTSGGTIKVTILGN